MLYLKTYFVESLCLLQIRTLPFILKTDFSYQISKVFGELFVFFIIIILFIIVSGHVHMLQRKLEKSSFVAFWAWTEVIRPAQQVLLPTICHPSYISEE